MPSRLSYIYTCSRIPCCVYVYAHFPPVLPIRTQPCVHEYEQRSDALKHVNSPRFPAHRTRRDLSLFRPPPNHPSPPIHNTLFICTYRIMLGRGWIRLSLRCCRICGAWSHRTSGAHEREVSRHIPRKQRPIRPIRFIPSSAKHQRGWEKLFDNVAPVNYCRFSPRHAFENCAMHARNHSFHSRCVHILASCRAHKFTHSMFDTLIKILRSIYMQI